MSQVVMVGANLVAIAVLVFAIYFPRHRDREMVVAYLGINTGVVAVATALSSMDVSVGLGIGLFGVLSIIRLRSDELDQRQVAYYFASLALGLLGGAGGANPERSIALMALLVAALWFGDNPRLLSRYRTQMLTVDRAFTSERELATYVAPLIDGSIRKIAILRTDLVNDTTLASVRYVEEAGAAARDRLATIGAFAPERGGAS